MKVKRSSPVFNLYDTNGRRKDIINAYNIYTRILEQTYEETGSWVWGNYPKEQTQFRFYELAIENSPEVFQKHPKYDAFIKAMENPLIKEAFDKKDVQQLKQNPTLRKLYEDLDAAIEKRARHYTSNLVKIGLANEQRQVSSVGKSWIQGVKLIRSRFESLLPIDDTNLMFLRQLMKLRIYTADSENYYSPMLMAMYVLIKTERVHESLFIPMIQMLNPYLPVEPEKYVQDFLGGHSQKLEREYIPFESNPAFEEAVNEIMDEPVPMTRGVFFNHFTSGKSQDSTSVYYEFYEALTQFNSNQTFDNLTKLVEIFEDSSKKSKLNKAFGFGRNIFDLKDAAKTDVNAFLSQNSELDILSNDDINRKLFLQLKASKQHDAIQEYGDVTKRVMKVTGVISFKNGIVELKERELWKRFFEDITLEGLIFGESNAELHEQYEKTDSSPFLNNLNLEEIFEFSTPQTEKVISEVKQSLHASTEDEARLNLMNKTSRDFIEYINENYPLHKVLEILPLFSDRNNDKRIQQLVTENTNVPTIFEYIVGIAWYHFSSREFDLFNSLNLSMNADFEPETHAGGGAGDIVIEYDDLVVMLEVTMMNKNAQKRGEWEPVLRHATNLTIEKSDKEVMTIFIADELDDNTINIWRAVASVPLQSSKAIAGYTDKVIIMPLKNSELKQMLETGIKDEVLIQKIRESFEPLNNNFNREWRNEILAHS